MTHPDLVERLKDIRLCHDAAERDIREANQWLGSHGAVAHMQRGELLTKILTLQSSLAEQEKTISKLREEVKGERTVLAATREGFLKLESQLAEARNSGLESAAEIVNEARFTATHDLRELRDSIRSLKSKDGKKGE